MTSKGAITAWVDRVKVPWRPASRGDRGNGGRWTSSISGRARRRQGQTERSRCARSAACA